MELLVNNRTKNMITANIIHIINNPNNIEYNPDII